MARMQDEKKRNHWREDAERGSILAMLCPAESYNSTGEAIPNLDKAYYGYEQAARHGSGEGMYALGRLAEAAVCRPACPAWRPHSFGRAGKRQVILFDSTVSLWYYACNQAEIDEREE